MEYVVLTKSDQDLIIQEYLKELEKQHFRTDFNKKTLEYIKNQEEDPVKLQELNRIIAGESELLIKIEKETLAYKETTKV